MIPSLRTQRPCKEPSSADKFIAEQMLSRPWCPDPCVTSDPQHMVGQRSFDKLAASRCRRLTPLSWKSLWRAASSKRPGGWRRDDTPPTAGSALSLLGCFTGVPVYRALDPYTVISPISQLVGKPSCRWVHLRTPRLASRYKLWRTSNDEEDGLQGKIQKCKWDTNCWTTWRRVSSHISSS